VVEHIVSISRFATAFYPNDKGTVDREMTGPLMFS
jgi:hypothetical protein